MTTPEQGVRRATAWVDHLRAGGATPWVEFTGTSDREAPVAVAPGRDLPGAAHLELVRRLNAVAEASSGGGAGPAHSALVDRVFATSQPGRGLPELALVDVPSRSSFGPPPVDPADVPESELLRVAVGALAEETVTRDPGPAQRRQMERRPWHRGLRLGGDPLAAAGVRAGLRSIGHVPGRRDPVAVVLADDLSVMLADTWSRRLQVGNHPAWSGWLGHAHHNDALPPALQLPAVAAKWAAEVGPGNVHVMVGPDPGNRIGELIEAPQPIPVLRNRLSPEALEVLRHTNMVLRVLVRERDHRRVLETVLLPRMAREQGARRVVPPEEWDWVTDQARRLRTEMADAGYPVHGDLDDLLPREPHPVPPGAAPGPDGSGVLDVALRTLLEMKEDV